MSCILSPEPNSRNAASHFELPESECSPSSTEVVVADSTLSADLASDEVGWDIGPNTDFNPISAGGDDNGPDVDEGYHDTGDDDVDDNNRGYLAADLGLSAQKSVSQWRIRALGRRPKDFLARDCLFGSMFRDHRATWFHRYLRKTPDWMKDLVSHLPKESRRQALQCVVLDYLHKLHLTRLIETAIKEFGDDSEEMKRLSRLWQCPPYTVQIENRNDPDAPIPHGCGLFHLCPWCFARKVTELAECISKSVLANPKGKCLVLAKATPYAEPFFGRNDQWERADLCAINSGGWVRNYYGRYYGLHRDRAIQTRNYLAKSIREMNRWIFFPMEDGLLTHQMGSAQDANDRRTFLHDMAVIGVMDAKDLDIIRSDPHLVVSDNGNALELHAWIDDNLSLRGLVIPADHPSALRTVLAGTGWSYSPERFGLDRSEQKEGISGALSWQPTFLLDDQVWFAYAETTRHLRLYRPFGSWRHSLASAVAESKETVDGKFRRRQHDRLAHRQQQAGNQKRRRSTGQRRTDLLKVVKPLWVHVVGEVHDGRGRPAYRSRLHERMKQAGIEPSRRDLEWLIKSLRNEDKLGKKDSGV